MSTKIELSKQQKKSQETKEKIFQAAKKILQKSGYEKLSIKNICEEAGVSNGSFYHHFKTKDDLLSYYIEDQPTMGPDLLETPKSLEDVKDGIVRVYLNYVAYCRELGVEFMAGYYDTKNQAYTTLDNKSANELFKKFFMTGFVADTNYKNLKSVTDTLQSFISNEYDATENPDGVRLDTTNMKLVYTDANGKTTTQYYNNNGAVKTAKESGYDNDTVDTITFKNICVKRSVDLKGTTAGTYEQSITTDIVLTEPEYNVSFDTSSVASNTLYEYAILADMGVEVGEDNDNKTTDAQIKGNIYAASDYYNKDYNDVAETKVTNKYESKPSTMWGTKDSSAYSGIFVNGKNTSLTLNSDVVVCSGSLAAYNGAEINLSGRTQTLSELWADNIVIGGKDGGSLKASADAYIFDDTELNAEKASLKFTQGSYFGYSYNAQDTRSLNYLRQKGYLATGYKLRSHFSDSAIIVNGKNSTLDLQELNSLYIAGKSYIEFSKIAASSVPEDDENITVDENADYAFTTLEDYSTGQSLDVKTNQPVVCSEQH